MNKRNKPRPDRAQNIAGIIIIGFAFTILARHAFGSFDQEYLVSTDMLENYDKPIEEIIPEPYMAPDNNRPAETLKNAKFVLTKVQQEIQQRAEQKIAEDKAEEARKAEEAKKVTQKVSIPSGGVKDIIYAAADKYGVSRKQMYCLAVGESSLDPNNKHGQWTWIDTNGDGRVDKKIWTIDRGLYQWNSYWKSYVSDSCAFDAVCSANQAALEVKQGKIKQWYAIKYEQYKNCMAK